MKVIFTARARADLRSIGRWIARDNPPRAISFVTELRDKALELRENHLLYPTLSDADEHRHIRRLNHRDYRVIYRVDADVEKIAILFIHHGARATPAVI